jgi:nucleotide-binding universal stress UspA family protein
MMFSHILVTVDGSRASEAVVPYAIDLARRVGARMTLLRVVNTVGATHVKASERGAVSPGGGLAWARERGEREAQDYLDSQVKKLASADVSLQTLVRSGDPAAEVLAAARETGADTIAMATHSRRGLDRLMMGSVAERVVHGSPAPVLLLRVD